jgi:hypothetical protein
MLLNRCLLRVPRTISTMRIAGEIHRVGLQRRFFRYDGLLARESLAPKGRDSLVSELTKRTISNRNSIYYRCRRREYHRLELVSEPTTHRRCCIFRSCRLRKGTPPISLLNAGSIIHFNSCNSTIATGSTASACIAFVLCVLTLVIIALFSRPLQSTNRRTILHRSIELSRSLPSTRRSTLYRNRINSL